MKQTLSFIKPSPGFKYSVNVKYDLDDFDKINSFIPTAGSIRLFHELLNSFEKNSVTRAHLFIGAYGTGKSLYAMILGSLLTNKKKLEFDFFLNKIKKYDLSLAEQFAKLILEKEKYLLVLPSNHKNFKQSMILGLQKALKKEGLANIFPSTYFKSVMNKLIQWESEFETTYKQLAVSIEEDLGLSITQFLNNIQKFDEDSYSYFVNLYPKLTAGGDFNPFYGCDLNEIYEDITREIKKMGYQGIFVIFDEFNKLLENDIEFFDGIVLQDFAEMVSRSEENEIHLLLISHKSLLQYTTRLSNEQIVEWKKIEGRFRKVDVSQYTSQVYELISNVLLKEKNGWTKFLTSRKKYFSKLLRETSLLELFPNFNQDQLDDVIIKGCYPLHPTTTYALPVISQKVAQNERTIFTYLSTLERFSLGEFIKKDFDNEYPLLYLDSIYDYFADLMKHEYEHSQVYQAWFESQRALQKIGKGDKIDRSIIKSLGIIYAVNMFSALPPSKEMICFALGCFPTEDIEDALERLENNKIILYRHSIQQYKFFDGSDVDIKKHVKEIKDQKQASFSFKYLLDSYFNPSIPLPREHNDRYKLVRYFIPKYKTFDELTVIRSWDKQFKQDMYPDGYIFYTICETNAEIEQTIEYASSNTEPQIIFVIPKKPLRIIGLLSELDALIQLSKQSDFIEADDLVKMELEAYIDETKKLIENKLLKVIDPHYEEAYYFNNTEKMQFIKSRKDLSRKISEICNQVFLCTPIINNELIVKNKISGAQRSARKNLVKQLLFSELKERLDIEGFGPEYLIYRSVLIKTNLFRIENDTLVYNYQNPNSVDQIVTVIEEFFNQSQQKAMCFEELYRILQTKPYGVRLGVIPLLLAYYSRLTLKRMIIRHNGVEANIDEETFEKINLYPGKYTLEIDTWDELQENYISYIESFVKEFSKKQRINQINRLQVLSESLTRWYQCLPKYSRETTQMSSTSLIMRKIIQRQSPEVKKTFMEIIPLKLIATSLSHNSLKHLKQCIKDFFGEHHAALENLVSEVECEIISIFNRNKTTINDALKEWFNSLPKRVKNHTYSKEINSMLSLIRNLDNVNYSSKKLLDKISLLITGFNMEDWNDKTKIEFLKRLKEIKNELDAFEQDRIEIPDDYRIKLNLKDDVVERTFTREEISGIGKLLENKIRSSIRDVGSAVSENQKRQILIEILRDLLG